MEQQPNSIYGSHKSKRMIPKKPVLMGLLGLLLIVGVIAGAVWLLNGGTGSGSNRQVYRSPGICTDDTSAKAQTYMNGGGEVLDFYNLVAKFKENEKYKDDINCVYIALNYNLQKNISTGNDELIAQYKQLIKIGGSISSQFNPKVELATLERTATSVKEINEVQAKSDQEQTNADMESLRAAAEVKGQP